MSACIQPNQPVVFLRWRRWPFNNHWLPSKCNDFYSSQRSMYQDHTPKLCNLFIFWRVSWNNIVYSLLKRLAYSFHGCNYHASVNDGWEGNFYHRTRRGARIASMDYYKAIQGSRHQTVAFEEHLSRILRHFCPSKMLLKSAFDFSSTLEYQDGFLV